MSCFIMEPRAIAALADGIATLLNSDYTFAGIDMPEKMYDALSDCRDKYGYFREKQIFAALFDLNAAAYAGRYREEKEPIPDYPDDVPHLIKPAGYNGHYLPGETYWKYYKLLDCLIYQTTEDTTRNTHLYAAILSFNRTLSAYLVRNCDAYEKAEWGRV